MTIRRKAVAAVAGALMLGGLLAPAALANPSCHASTTNVGGKDLGSPVVLGIVPVTTPAGTFYIDDRDFVFGNGLWVYHETNNTAGLQRGFTSYAPGFGDICDEGPNSDTVVF